MKSSLRRMLAMAAIAIAATSSNVPAQTWTGTANTLWTDTGNWDTATVPVSGNTASFVDAGNGNTSISLSGASQPIGSIVFDTANVAAYTLGGLGTGDQFNVDAGGSITSNSAVTTLQTINATIAGNSSLTIANAGIGGLTLADDISAGGGLALNNSGASTMTVGGTITNATSITADASAGTINFTGSPTADGVIAVNGAGTIAFNAPIADGANSAASLSNTMTGALVLNAQNTYTGGTTINMTAAQGSVRIGADQAFGTGPINLTGTLPALFSPIGADRTIPNDIGTVGTPASAGMFWETANATIDPTGPHNLTFTGNIFLTGSRTFTNNLVGGTVTLGSSASPGTITRNNNLTFQSQAQVQPTGGVMILNDAIAASTGTSGNVTFQNGLKVTVNNTIGGNGSIVVQCTAAPNTVAHFNKTGMYTGTGNVTIQVNNASATTGSTVYFDQPNVFGATTSAFPTTSILTTTGLGTTVYVNNPLIVNHRWDIEGDAVVYFNAPTTFNGTSTSAFQVQQINARKQTAMVINSTLTRGPNAGSGVRVATGTLAGNGGTIMSGVGILNSTNGPSYLAPGTPAISGDTNMTPAYQNGSGLLTIGSLATPFNLDFNGTSNCAGCNLYAEIGGTTPGTQFDQVVVNGTATIGTATAARAHLTVALINGYTRPAADTNFEIIKATTLSSGLGFIDAALPDANWSVLYGPASTPNSLVVHVAGTGDFNGDHIVDAGDYVAWRKNDGTPGGYDAFRRNFGNIVPGAGSGSGLDGGAVPEPCTIALLGTALIALVCPRRRCYSSARFLD